MEALLVFALTVGTAFWLRRGQRKRDRKRKWRSAARSQNLRESETLNTWTDELVVQGRGRTVRFGSYSDRGIEGTRIFVEAPAFGVYGVTIRRQTESTAFTKLMRVRE